MKSAALAVAEKGITSRGSWKQARLFFPSKYETHGTDEEIKIVALAVVEKGITS
jgi:hypothetical protein